MIKIYSANALMLVFLLTACAAHEVNRYKDTGELERPPKVITDKQAAEAQETNAVVAPKKNHKSRHGKGLGTDVYRTEGSPLALKLRRNYDEAWLLLHHAIQQNELKVSDQDRSKGNYYVAYKDSGFLGEATALFKDEKQNLPIYLLKVEGQGEETKVTASLASKDEQTNAASSQNAGTGSPTEDESAKLINLLYKTLHDDAKGN